MSKIHAFKYCILRGFVRINKKITGKIQVKYSLVQINGTIIASLYQVHNNTHALK